MSHHAATACAPRCDGRRSVVRFSSPIGVRACQRKNLNSQLLILKLYFVPLPAERLKYKDYDSITTACRTLSRNGENSRRRGIDGEGTQVCEASGCQERRPDLDDEGGVLRSIWKHEAKDFTPWLAEEENISRLSEDIGIDIVLEEQESNVGEFSVDIFATEEGTGRKIIIENQLEDTNHDHLGKIITYASGKDAEVIIWIVKRARDEHKQAIEWLNNHTDDKCAFFLIEIELWRIGKSDPAVKFNIVERPNDWAKSMKKSSSLTQGGAQKLNFWQQFIEYNQANNGVYAKSMPTSDTWIGKSIKGIPGTRVNIVVTKDSCRIEANINSGNQEKNKNIFDALITQKDVIEQEYGAKFVWQHLDEKKTCRIYEERPLSYISEDDRQAIFQFFCDATNRMLTSFGHQAKLFKK